MRDDLRSAFRQIRSNPGFTTAVVLTLALGVGATTAVFTLADPMLFRPLPFPDSHQLVRVWVTGANGELFGTGPLVDYLQTQSHHRGFSANCTFRISVSGRMEGLDASVLAYSIDEACLGVLRTRPMIGRPFASDEYVVANPDRPAETALITHGFWQTAFGGRPDIVGQSMTLTWRRPYRFVIVGVLPPEFFLPQTINQQPSVILPGKPDVAQASKARLAEWIARLAPGVSIEQATAELQAIVAGVEREYPAIPQGRTALVTPLQDSLFGRVRTPLLMLLGVTACVLLLACANLAHLFLARIHARQRELGVRLAMGAGRWQLVRQLVIEAALIAVIAGAAAVVIAQWVFALIMSQTPDFVWVYRLVPGQLDMRVFAFLIALVLVALIIYAVVPAVMAARRDVRESLQPSAATTTPRRSEGALILAQTAIAVSLLVTGALIVQSFVKLAYQPLGFQPFGLQSVRIELGQEYFEPKPARAPVIYRQIYEGLRDRLGLNVALVYGLPGVVLPLGANRPDAPPKQSGITAYPVSGTAFDVLQLQLKSGRVFDDREAFDDAPVAVVDQQGANRLWPGQEPLGQTIVDTEGTRRTVIGTVATLRRPGLQNDDAGGGAFIPLPLSYRSGLSIRPGTQRVPVEQIRAIVHEFAPGVPVTVVDQRPFERTLGQPRFLATLLGVLSLLTIALTMVGVFAVVSHGAARRTREVGIRIALGAAAGRIYRLMLTGAAVPASLGIALGLIASYWWARTLETLLFGVVPHDVTTFAGIAGFVMALVIAASLLPTWRATQVDPTVTLRVE